MYLVCKPDDLSSDPQGPHKRPDTCATGAQTSWLLEGSLKNQDGDFVTVSIHIVSLGTGDFKLCIHVIQSCISDFFFLFIFRDSFSV